MKITLLTMLALSDVNPELIDISDYRANLRVYSDGHNHDVALWAGDSSNIHLFYGDGHTFYELATYSIGLSGDHFDAQFIDPRYGRTRNDSGIMGNSETIDVSCGKRQTKLTKLDKPVYKAMIAKAEFRRGPWAFQPYALARDDRGTYYYVDQGRFDDNNRAFRVYIGPRGALKEQKLKNIVHDSAGDVFATAEGDLRLIIGEKPQTEWVNKDQRVKLTAVDVRENLQMIWNELGVYTRVRYGTPCDDL